uniref:Uncharacterized protein n=1 Tax=Oryza brachyantha TaxID=4533 RepID=J3LTF6_ORYBR
MAMSPAAAASAMSAALHIPACSFTVHSSPPDHFVFFFSNSGDRDLALARSPIPAASRQLILCPWSRLALASAFPLPFRVSLDLEGIPVHAWNPSTSAALIAPCRLISLDTAAGRPEDYQRLGVSALAPDLALIPREKFLLIPEPALPSGVPTLLQYQIFIRLLQTPTPGSATCSTVAATFGMPAEAAKVVPKRSKRIAAMLARSGSGDAITRAQRVLVLKLGLAPEAGPIPPCAMSDLDALFAKPLPQDHIVALSKLFSSSPPFLQATEQLARSSTWSISDPQLAEFSLSARVRHHAETVPWWLTIVYGPQEEPDKLRFLDELRSLRPSLAGPWAVAGDFNLILEARDKSNSNINRRMMGRFRRLIDELDLLELPLRGCRYTWSSERASPTLVKLDQVFYSSEWEELFPSCLLQAASSVASDHCGLLLHTCVGSPKAHRFRFEAFWPSLDGFLQVEEDAWHPPANLPPLAALAWCLSNTAKRLQSWSDRHVGSVRIQLLLAKEIVFRFDVAQESRPLSPLEAWLRRDLKLKCLGFDRLNDALIALLPKKDEAVEVGDFRPISLIHSFGKLFSKILASRLSPRLDALVEVNQSAFVKGRSIHNNFCFAQLATKALHAKRTPRLLLKVDIAKAFDTVSWPFLLEDLEFVQGILSVFGLASGIRTNFSKCSITPICYSAEDLDLIRSSFPCSISDFPCSYLGIPLSVWKLPRSALQPLVDKVSRRLPPWKGRLLSLVGRKVLVQSVLSSIPVHVAISVGLPAWAVKAIDKKRHAFLWTGSDSVHGGQCKVAWANVCRPKALGGLGILNLRTAGFALRLRWLWLQHSGHPY